MHCRQYEVVRLRKLKFKKGDKVRTGSGSDGILGSQRVGTLNQNRER